MPAPLSEPALEQIRREIAAGRKIDAIRLYREATHEGLKEAKDAIEAIEAGQSPAPPASGAVPGQVLEQIRRELFAGRKISAIKIYRTATGAQLKDSHDAIEALDAELRAAEPAKFTAPPAKAGCLGLILFLSATGLALSWLA